MPVQVPFACIACVYRKKKCVWIRHPYFDPCLIQFSTSRAYTVTMIQAYFCKKYRTIKPRCKNRQPQGIGAGGLELIITQHRKRNSENFFRLKCNIVLRLITESLTADYLNAFQSSSNEQISNIDKVKFGLGFAAFIENDVIS